MPKGLPEAIRRKPRFTPLKEGDELCAYPTGLFNGEGSVFLLEGKTPRAGITVCNKYALEPLAYVWNVKVKQTAQNSDANRLGKTQREGNIG